MKVKDFLTDYCKKNGWGVTYDDLAEALVECGKIVHKGKQDEHRWYILQTVVAELDGKFIQYKNYIITGDNSMSDMDLHYNLDEAKFVEKKERTVIETYYEEIK